MSPDVFATALLVALGLLLLALVGVFLLALRRSGPAGRVITGREVARRNSVAALARSRGWWLAQGTELADRAFEPGLSAARISPERCELVVDGGPDAFVAESWSVRGRNVGAPMSMPAVQHVLRVPRPHGAAEFLVRPLPRRRELRFFPQQFRDRSGFVRYHVMMLVAGDIAAVQDRLAPLVEDIHRSRLWVVGLGDELVLMSTNNEPDAPELERRLALARAIVAALS